MATHRDAGQRALVQTLRDEYDRALRYQGMAELHSQSHTYYAGVRHGLQDAIDLLTATVPNTTVVVEFNALADDATAV